MVLDPVARVAREDLEPGVDDGERGPELVRESVDELGPGPPETGENTLIVSRPLFSVVTKLWSAMSMMKSPVSAVAG